MRASRLVSLVFLSVCGMTGAMIAQSPGQASHLRRSESSANQPTTSPTQPAGSENQQINASVPIVTEKISNQLMENYKKSVLTRSLCWVEGDTVPSPISQDALNAYNAAGQQLITPETGKSLTPQDQAVNQSVCNVAKAVLNSKQALTDAQAAQKNEIDEAAPDLLSQVTAKTNAIIQALTPAANTSSAAAAPAAEAPATTTPATTPPTLTSATTTSAPAATAVPAVKTPATPMKPLNQAMDTSKSSELTGSKCWTKGDSVPTTISQDALNAYNAADNEYITAETGKQLTQQQQAVNQSVCNVAKAVLNSTQALTDAKAARQNEIKNAEPDLLDAVKGRTQNVIDALAPQPKKHCTIDNSDPQNPVYTYKLLMPLHGAGCDDASIENYYNVSGKIGIASNVRYLYGVTASSNAVGSDLFTATFPVGFQLNLGANATVGSSCSSSTNSSTGGSGGSSGSSSCSSSTNSSTGGSGGSSGSSSNSTQSTDSTATAISKLEQGGDFYVQGRYPLLQWSKPDTHFTLISQFAPKAGFTVSGLGSQQTITQATDMNIFYPIEVYGQMASTSGSTDAALLFLDAQVGGEYLDSDLAKTLGFGQNFFLGEFAIGVEFNQSIRVSFQNFVGNKDGFYTPAGTTTKTGKTTSLSGWHIAVELLPKGLTKK